MKLSEKARAEELEVGQLIELWNRLQRTALGETLAITTGPSAAPEFH